MPNANVVVSTVARIDQPVDQMVRSDRGFSFDLSEGRRLRLDPATPNAAGRARLLGELHRLKLPVYLEFDPGPSIVTRLLIPGKGRRPREIEVGAVYGRQPIGRNQRLFFLSAIVPQQKIRLRANCDRALNGRRESRIVRTVTPDVCFGATEARLSPEQRRVA